MGNTPMYELQYLPLFYDDLLATVKYLSEVLHNPKAANKLIDDVENAILNRLPNAEAFEPFHSLKERRYPYYRIYVNNYIVYYVVIEHRIMEVRRLLYVGRNRDQMERTVPLFPPVFFIKNSPHQFLWTGFPPAQR